MKRYFISIVFCITTFLSFGQTNPEKELGSWYMLFGTHQVSGKLSINTGIQLRNYEVVSNYNLNLLYTGINYKIDSNILFTFNYGYLDIDKSIEFTNIKNTIEHRFWEQLSFKHKLSKIPINHRFRFEHRFLHDLTDNSIQNRIRYRLGTHIDLNQTFFIVANKEFFLNIKGETFRENRLYFGLGIKLNKQFKLQLGYLNQHINNLNLNRLQFGLYIKTDLRKRNNSN
ncbi:DUF2490 domain-containing protein [Psychroserpens ponticola]|uniref:DUF2490 domain-containing protein n=1 Tax=Psychroserpens ponticola TaxID=2932268 RepID=A0ABY7S0Z6_9FLAO|nr:DUF2490 domain-containing protein [Psychroserpens ponticola]WCO02839.1 DUF2490 domain-containing protein [Psychroserpens ponticola]